MDKRPEKMTEQDALLEIQMRAAPESRAVDMITMITLLFVIGLFAILFIVSPDKAFSDQENRVLQQLPAVSSKFEGSFAERVAEGKMLDRLIDGKYTAEIAKYYADQFPARDLFVGIKGIAEIAQFKRENNNIVLARGNYLVKRDDFPNYEVLGENLASVADFSAGMQKIGVPVTYAMAGRPVDVLTAYLPGTFPTDYSDKLWNFTSEKMAAIEGLQFVNLRESLKAISDSGTGEQIYYKTDHHWTTLGAFYAYGEIARAFELEAPLEFGAVSNVENASGEFFGTTWSNAGMKWVKPDNLQYYRFSGDEFDYKTTIADTGKSFNGFYDRTYLSVKDKYSSFLGGNNGRVDVQNIKETGREKLLIIKDSFAHSVAPFLAYNYDLVIIDPRYYKEPIKKIVVEERIDRVLILNYIGSMTESNVMGIIKYNLDTEYTAPEIIEDVPDVPVKEYPIKQIFVNNNPLGEYVIVCPNEESEPYAEHIRKSIFDKSGIDLPIEYSEEYTAADKAIVLTDGGLPGKGFIEFKLEGNALVIRCSMESGMDYGTKQFISRYIKDAKGSFNFAEGFIYSDVSNEAMLMPE